jgi:hypothetical protein
MVGRPSLTLVGAGVGDGVARGDGVVLDVHAAVSIVAATMTARARLATG